VTNLISTLERGAAKVEEITGQSGVIEQKYQRAHGQGRRLARDPREPRPAGVGADPVRRRAHRLGDQRGINAPIEGFKAAVTRGQGGDRRPHHGGR
jgi:hypothetical protein